MASASKSSGSDRGEEPIPNHEPSADVAENRKVAVWKAVGLSVVLVVVGIALMIVLWLLATLTISLIGSL